MSQARRPAAGQVLRVRFAGSASRCFFSQSGSELPSAIAWRRSSDEVVPGQAVRCHGLWSRTLTGRQMILWDGACMVHEIFSLEKITRLRHRHPNAKSYHKVSQFVSKEVLTTKNGPVEAEVLAPGEEADFRLQINDQNRAVHIRFNAEDKDKRDLRLENSGPFTIE